MNKVFRLINLLSLVTAFGVLAQDLGPVGPKQTSGTHSQKSINNKNTDNLPYKPSSAEKKSSTSKKAKTSESETIVPVEVKKEFVVPPLKSIYPPAVGAPDFGL